MRKLKLLGVVAVLAATLLQTAPTALAHGEHAEERLRTYHVTLRNLTNGQPFSPPVAATHERGMHVFRVGNNASDELAAIARGGDEGPLANLLRSSDDVSDVVDVARPLTPAGKTIGAFTDTVEFDITAEPGDRFSLATMLICTNDGFLGVDAVKLPKHGARSFDLAGYDAGREENTEKSADIVDPCSGLGPAPLAGDPNGNNDATVETIPAKPIALHPGIQGGGDLSPANHGWRDPVARLTIERVD